MNGELRTDPKNKSGLRACSTIEKCAKSKNSSYPPYIRDVMKTKDGCWKYFLLHGLINRLSKEKLLELKPELIRMKFSPTMDEQQEELAEKIDELLARLD